MPHSVSSYYCLYETHTIMHTNFLTLEYIIIMWAKEQRPTRLECVNNNLHYPYMLWDKTSYVAGNTCS